MHLFSPNLLCDYIRKCEIILHILSTKYLFREIFKHIVRKQYFEI